MQILLVLSTFVFVLIVALVLNKSNAPFEEKDPLEMWAIIGGEFVEYTLEEAEWRARYVK